jgi:hypothetical protein
MLGVATAQCKPSIMSNPFYISGSIPSQYFAGRDQMMKTAFSHIAKRGNAAFYGVSGIGKSSLLRFIGAESAWQKYGEELDISNFYPVFIDCLSIVPFTTQKFFRQVLESLISQFSEETELIDLVNSVLIQGEIDRADLGTILGKIERDHKTLLLLLDDFDCALAPHESQSEQQILELVSDLRALSIYGRSHFVIFITAYRPVFDITPSIARNNPSPWYNQYSSNYLEPFNDKEIEKIFFQADSYLEICPISESLKAAVLEMTHGHPALLQHAGHLLHEVSQSKDSFPSPNIFAENLLVRTEHRFQNIWRCSTEKEQVLLMLIAINNQEGCLNHRRFNLRNFDSILSQYTKELVYLKKSILIESADTLRAPRYSFASSIMEWWVLQEIIKDDGASLKKYEIVFLSSMNQEQMDNIKQICTHVWKAKDDMASFVERMIKLKS